MELYLDMIYLTNLLYDLVLVIIISKIIQVNRGRGRMVFAAALSSMGTMIVMLLSPYYTLTGVWLSFIRFILGILMLKIAFGIKTIAQWIMAILSLYSVSFLLDGLFRYLQNVIKKKLSVQAPIVSLIGMLLFGFFFINQLIHMLRQKRQRQYSSHPVMIRVGTNEVSARGLFDSGNSLKEPITQKPVVVVERSLLSQKSISEPKVGFFAIPYHAVGTEHGILKGFLADELHILDEDGEKVIRQVMIGIYEGKLSMQGDYQVLLHPDLNEL